MARTLRSDGRVLLKLQTCRFPRRFQRKAARKEERSADQKIANDALGAPGAVRFTRFAARKLTPKLSVWRAACYDKRWVARC